MKSIFISGLSLAIITSPEVIEYLNTRVETCHSFKMVLKIEGLKCQGCAQRVKQRIDNEDMISSVSFKDKEITIYSKHDINVNELRETIALIDLGYRIQVVEKTKQECQGDLLSGKN